MAEVGTEAGVSEMSLKDIRFYLSLPLAIVAVGLICIVDWVAGEYTDCTEEEE